MGDDADRTTIGAIGRVPTVVLVAVLVVSSVAGPVAAADQDARSTDQSSALIVDLAADGDATVTVTLAFDLEDEADRAAFEELRTNETKHERLETRTATRMENVVAAANEEVDREMSIDGSEVAFETNGSADRGIVAVSVTWRSLAAVEGDALRLDEPFASGFAPDRPFVLRSPDGYELESASHEPSTTEDGRFVWATDRQLDGYEVVLSATGENESADGQGTDESADGSETSEPTASSDSNGSTDEDRDADGQPGFGAGFGLLAALAAGWLLRDR